MRPRPKTCPMMRGARRAAANIGAMIIVALAQPCSLCCAHSIALTLLRSFGSDGSLALGLDLIDGIDHRIESQHGRGVTGLVVAHRLEHRDVGPLTFGG